MSKFKMKWQLNPNYNYGLLLLMFHSLLLVYVMILDKKYFWKIFAEDDTEKNYAGWQLGCAGAFRPNQV